MNWLDQLPNDPGYGKKPPAPKTQIVKDLCKKRGWPIKTIIVSDPERDDWKGLPKVKDKYHDINNPRDHEKEQEQVDTVKAVFVTIFAVLFLLAWLI